MVDARARETFQMLGVSIATVSQVMTAFRR